MMAVDQNAYTANPTTKTTTTTPQVLTLRVGRTRIRTLQPLRLPLTLITQLRTTATRTTKTMVTQTRLPQTLQLQTLQTRLTTLTTQTAQ